MSKTLIIAEKPSVATDLARVLGKLPELGKFERKKTISKTTTPTSLLPSVTWWN